MTYKQLLFTLIIFGYASIATSKSASPESVEKPLIIPAEKLINIVITKEEAFYIFLECKQFATEDKIDTEFVNDYVELCSYELTQAVKTAKYQRKKKSSATPILKHSQPDSPRPL